MPPRIPVHFPWASRTSIVSPNGFLTSSCIRLFSSTNPSLALGPESPNYIEVPKPLQPTFPLKPQSKGHLPVPRDVFKTRSRTPKESEVFIKRASRTPKKENVKMPGPYSRDADYRLYKQRLAETRRRALNEGVTELYGRKVTMEADHQAKIQRNNVDRKARAMAPPRTVDVLTQTSVSKGIRDFLDDKLPKTPRETVVRSRQRAYARRLTKQDDVRRERLHDLYTNAREFIVDEQQLDDAIEKAFGSEDQPVRWDNRGAISPNATGLSPWDGPMPEGVGDKLQKLKGGEGVGLAKERVKKVAEALTGGKM